MQSFLITCLCIGWSGTAAEEENCPKNRAQLCTGLGEDESLSIACNGVLTRSSGASSRSRPGPTLVDSAELYACENRQEGRGRMAAFSRTLSLTVRSEL